MSISMRSAALAAFVWAPLFGASTPLAKVLLAQALPLRLPLTRSPMDGRRRGNRLMKGLLAPIVFLTGVSATPGAVSESDAGPEKGRGPVYEVRPIGWVRKADGKTTIEVERQYQPALMGVEELEAIWVLYWLDRNDTPQGRGILQVHPRGNPENPLRGVFATRAPVRPNLIALSRCRVLSVDENVITIEEIDALPDTPVLDIKP